MNTFPFSDLPLVLQRSIYEKLLTYQQFATLEGCSKFSQSFCKSNSSSKFAHEVEHILLSPENLIIYTKKLKTLRFPKENYANVLFQANSLQVDKSATSEDYDFVYGNVLRVEKLTIFQTLKYRLRQEKWIIALQLKHLDFYLDKSENYLPQLNKIETVRIFNAFSFQSVLSIEADELHVDSHLKISVEASINYIKTLINGNGRRDFKLKTFALTGSHLDFQGFRLALDSLKFHRKIESPEGSVHQATQMETFPFSDLPRLLQKSIYEKNSKVVRNSLNPVNAILLLNFRTKWNVLWFPSHIMVSTSTSSAFFSKETFVNVLFETSTLTVEESATSENYDFVYGHVRRVETLVIFHTLEQRSRQEKWIRTLQLKHLNIFLDESQESFPQLNRIEKVFVGKAVSLSLHSVLSIDANDVHVPYDIKNASLVDFINYIKAVINGRRDFISTLIPIRSCGTSFELNFIGS